MNSTKLPSTHFSGLENDFKAEVIAAEMVEAGTDPERILILMLGALKRTFSRDVESVAEELSEYDHKEYQVVKTPKEGIYDMLPEGLFHRTAGQKSARTEKEMVTSMKQQRAEEQNARKFFLPFEATINYMRMQTVLYENRLDKRSHYNDLVDIFSGHWEIFQYLDARQSNIFLHLIPIMYDLRDDHPVIEKVMEMMLLLPVGICLSNQLPLHPANPIMSKMGESLLGVDLTTGNAVYDEGVDEISVKIGPMPAEVLNDFIGGGTKSKILQLLSDYLLPVHLDIITEFVLEEKGKMTRLANDASNINSTLGADTYL